MKILQICYNEFKEIFSDIGIVIFVIILPLAYPLLYAYVYDNEVVREVPVVVVDDSQTNISREFLRRCDASPDIKIISHATGMENARTYLERTDAYGIIRIPREFSDDIAKGHQTVVGIYCDMASMMYYKNLMITVAVVAQDMNKEIKVSKLGSSTDREAEISAAPVTYESKAMYNPQSGYSSFLIPAVLMLIIQQSLMLGIGMHMGGTREQNFGFAIPKGDLYRNPIYIYLGKMLAYFIIYIVDATYFFVVVNKIFTLPQMSTFGTYLAWMVPYLIACISYSILFSVLVYRREDCIMLFVFLSLPLIFISGISWPISEIPQKWLYFSYLFPSSLGIHAYVRTNTMGASIDDIAFYHWGLIIQAAIYTILSLIFYYWQLKKRKIEE